MSAPNKLPLSIGFSSCPNDTFIFDALVHQRINLQGLAFREWLADVEELNLKAAKAELDITKLSIFAMLQLGASYQLLDSGAAFGIGLGPLIISKKNISPTDLKTARILVPGKNTTARLLTELYTEGQHGDFEEVIFSDIEQLLLDEKFDAGVIIHENRFTYKQKGLKLVADLGAYWNVISSNLPLPLGGIAIRRSFSDDLKTQVSKLLRNSLQFAMDHPDVALQYMQQHAQEMETGIMQQHVKAYVNEYSLSMGKNGRKAIRFLAQKASETGLIPPHIDIESLFVKN